jgi:uncharacterized protein (DUF302 family)
VTTQTRAIAMDVQATLKAKLGADIEPYRILGACNPPLAHRAISSEPTVGILLPCNVVLRAVGSKTQIEIADPNVMLDLIPSEEVRDVAAEAHRRLQRVIAAIKDQCSDRVTGSTEDPPGSN